MAIRCGDDDGDGVLAFMDRGICMKHWNDDEW